MFFDRKQLYVSAVLLAVFELAVVMVHAASF